ncbi:Spore germination protein A1 [compost metagenome]
MIHSQNHIYQAILAGSAVIIIDGLQTALVVSIAGGVKRTVEEPTSQGLIRGPKEGFTEDISTNLTLVRRKLRTPDLKFERHLYREIFTNQSHFNLYRRNCESGSGSGDY